MINKRDSFKNIKSYCLYYGYNNVDKLSSFDLAIVEPKAHALDSISKFKISNTLLIAYISVMEISKSDEEFEILQKEDFLSINNSPLTNKDFGTNILDLSSKNWTNILINKMNALSSRGFDGFFLDTIGDIENNQLSKIEADNQLFAAISLVKAIRNAFPNSILIQNNGLEQLCLYTNTIVDAICWENPPYNLRGSKSWVSKISNQLNELGTFLFILLENKNLPKNLFQMMRLKKFSSLFKKTLTYFANDEYL